MSQATLDALFPARTVASTASSSPSIYPGSTPESVETLTRLLKQNHRDFHVFFNDKGFHNHTSHHLLANYTLGASPSNLEAIYAVHAPLQRKLIASPGEITNENWKDHLDERSYYGSYVAFFTKEVLEHGSIATLETFVFGLEANYVEGRADSAQPKMLDRFFSGLLHPMIHVGHAVEFNLPGLMVEGLAMACVTEAFNGPLVPRNLWAEAETSPSLASMANKLSLSSQPEGGPTALDIFARFSKETDFTEFAQMISGRKSEIPDFMATMNDAIRCFAGTITAYVSEWKVDANDPKNIEAKIEELAWLASVLYGVGGQQGSEAFTADFFLMHIMTTSIFLPSFVSSLSPGSQEKLLKVFLSYAIFTWIIRGRLPLSITNFYSTAPAHPTPPGPLPSPHDSALDKPSAAAPNPWFAILQSTLAHPDEHLPKLQRTLAFYAGRYGRTARGQFKGLALDGAELLDGTLFVRAAGLTAMQIGWVREGEEKRFWGYV